MICGLILAAIIAWVQPFDLAFDAATRGVPALRAVAIVALAAIGAEAARRVGLHVHSRGQRGVIGVPVLVAMSVALACAGVDWAFRPVLHLSYVQVIATPLWLRTIAFMMRAFNENIIYRLFLGSSLAWVFGRVWKTAQGAPSQAAFCCAFALSQGLNVWINVTSQAPVTALSLLHDGLRYVVPGLVWSWLYWRRGFQANEVASTSVHLLFQPLVGLLLAT